MPGSGGSGSATASARSEARCTLLAVPVLAATALGASDLAGGPALHLCVRAAAAHRSARRRLGRPAAPPARAGRSRPGPGGRAVLVPVAAVFDRLSLGQVYLVEFLVGLGTVVFDVFQRAYMPGLVGRGRRSSRPTAGWSSTARSASPPVRRSAGSPGLARGGDGPRWPARSDSSGRRCGSPLGLRGARTAAGPARPASSGRRDPRGAAVRARRAVYPGHDVVRVRRRRLPATRYAVETLFLLRTVGLDPGVDRPLLMPPRASAASPVR